MKKAVTWFCAFVLACLLSANAFAITWVEEEFTCPIDSQKNIFLVVASYGGYIYSYPSKYQWLFFPRTDSPTFYLCKKCHLATYMWDFDKLPKDKLAEIRKVLAAVKVSKTFKAYTEISTTERLEIMEKVYSVLNKDDLWWEEFYRVKGYHYGAHGDSAKAAEERKKSLDLIQKTLVKNDSKVPLKLGYYISASMKHFLSDDKGAIEDLDKALTTKYAESGIKPEEVENAEKGLNDRIADYKERIKSPDKKPRTLEKENKEGH